jgi:hypothetical protein
MAFQSRKAFWMWARKRNLREIASTEYYRHHHKKSNFDLIEKSSRIYKTKTARGCTVKAAERGAKQSAAIIKQRVRAARNEPTSGDHSLPAWKGTVDQINLWKTGQHCHARTLQGDSPWLFSFKKYRSYPFPVQAIEASRHACVDTAQLVCYREKTMMFQPRISSSSATSFKRATASNPAGAVS